MPSPVTAESSRGRLTAGLLQLGCLLLARIRRVEHVDLRQSDDLRLVVQAAAIGVEFVAHGLVGLADLFFLSGDEVQQDTGALDMAEEAVADADALMRAFDQAGNVGQDEFALIDAWRRRGSGCSVVNG